MTFVNELISDEDKKNIDWTKFKAWPFSEPHRPWKWTIDKNRDVFLVALEGRGRESERPETYALYWKGVVIRIEAERDGKGAFSTGIDMYWNVLNIEIPMSLKRQNQEILTTLKESLDAHGSIYEREQVRSVYIQIAEERN